MPTHTLVNVHLRPCYGTISLFQTLSLSRVETLYLGMGVWDNFPRSSLINFPFMRQLAIEDIPWVTFQAILGMLTAPLIHTLAVLVEIDAYPREIALEPSLDTPADMPLLTKFTITVQHKPSNLLHMSAIVFMCGWTLPNITHFTTNIPVQFFDALYTPGQSLLLPSRCHDYGFTLGNNLPHHLTVPSFAFPRLRHLRAADPWLYMYTEEISRIVTFSTQNGIPLGSITLPADHFTSADLTELRERMDVHDWVEQGVDIDLASTALLLIQ